VTVEQTLLMWAVIGQFVVAFATFTAVAVALWGDRLKQKFGLGPELVLTLLDPEGELTKAWIAPLLMGIPERYYHLKVSNRHRWAPANNVRVLLTRLEKPAADGGLTNQALSGPLRLMWRFPEAHPQYPVVGPDHICDLGRLRQEGEFLLSTYVTPNNFAGSVKANQRMRVEIKAVADNAESEPLTVDIAWDGEWSDDTPTMATHLVVKANARSL